MSKDITKRIKTFEDACEALGNEHPYVKEYLSTVNINITTDDSNKLKKEIKSEGKKLWIYYKEKGYDLLKLQTKIKQNNFSYYQKNKNLLEKIELKLNINTKTKNNYIFKSGFLNIDIPRYGVLSFKFFR